MNTKPYLTASPQDQIATEIAALKAALAALESRIERPAGLLTTTSLADTNPAALGTAAPGNATTVSRSNHVHAMPTADNITSGTLADARLSSNVPLKNTANTFSADQIINATLGINAAAPSGFVFSVRQNNGTAGVLSIGEMGARRDTTNRSVSLVFGTGSTNEWLIGEPSGSSGFQIYDLVNDRSVFVVGQNGRVYITFAPRTSPASPETGEIYKDINGFLKIG